MLDIRSRLSFLILGLTKMSNNDTTLENATNAVAADIPDWGEEVDPFALPPRRKKTGGRKKGSLNKKTLQMRAAIAVLLVPGTDPRTFFATILKSKDAPLSLRFAAARELMPYMHPKLASVESRTGGRTHEDRLAEARRLLNDQPSNGEGH